MRPGLFPQESGPCRSRLALLAGLDIPDLSLITNGQRLAEMAGDLNHASLHRVNVSLDSLDVAAFRSITRSGDLSLTLAGIQAARHAGLAPVKLNTVVLRDLNDHEVAAIARYGLDLGCAARLLELMPIGCARPMVAVGG